MRRLSTILAAAFVAYTTLFSRMLEQPKGKVQMEFLVFLLWIGFCAAVATAANTRGRSAIGWFFLALFITPLLAVCFLIALPRDPKPPVSNLLTPEQRSRA